ncbi:tyrosine-type recombinase/integrase [Bacillus sp. V3B]|uniref:tyrosine-type recombinase/integrase n=1 Tax=Bacillus sp. V3B TaxID=2804915 RepID=UPI00210E7557|nr:tyrosine-type recombinase/integrase [Bacillus sp. V3B]MCQ6274683.1 tyrosine-type recombinase/integrase [Bacillus sp. V3B]
MNYEYTSKFSTVITNMFKFRESMGYNRYSYSSELYDFDQFCSLKYPNMDTLTKELVMEWAMRRETESVNMHKHRLITIRQLGKYMNFSGKESYIIPSDLIGSYEPYTPYIFADEEVITFFRTIDNIKPNNRTPFTEYTVPVFFRVAYGCGLRPNELRDLRRSDINLDTGTIFIHNSKTKRDRLISMTESLNELCRKYDKLADKLYPNRQWFFHMSVKDSHRRRWISNQLKKYWKEAGLDKKTGTSPRVYDFRHNYATRIIMKWFDAGEDVTALLPYLSSFMGHVEFQSTYYYIHLLPENLRKNRNFDWNKFNSLIPEVSYD